MSLPKTYLQNKSLYNRTLSILKQYPNDQFNILSEQYHFYNPESKLALEHQLCHIRNADLKEQCRKWITVGRKMMAAQIANAKTFSEICECAIDSIASLDDRR